MTDMLFDKTINSLFRKNIKEGDAGIEIEMELLGDNNPFDYDCPKGWAQTTDGSLRGNSVEFVTAGPVLKEHVDEKLTSLAQHLKKLKVEILNSYRAGVHIHVNVGQLSMNQVIDLATLYFLFETPLTRFCGPDREGNLFCLRHKDAEYIVQLILMAIAGENPGLFGGDNIRYSSVNFSALPKHGSLEFRSMRTPTDLSVISVWVKILLKLREIVSSPTFSLREVPMEISHFSPYTWLSRNLGENLASALNYETFDMDVMQDLRNLQILLYR